MHREKALCPHLNLFILFSSVFFSNMSTLHHKVFCSALKNPPSFFFLLLSLCALQQKAATNSITIPAHSSTTDTTLVWNRVLKVKVTPVPAMPITSDITPNGKTQRYQDFSVPPVACASLSSVGRESRGWSWSLSTTPWPSSPSVEPFKPWLWFSESWGKVFVSLLLPQSKSGWSTEAGGWRPEEQPILEVPFFYDNVGKAASWQWSSQFAVSDYYLCLCCYTRDLQNLLVVLSLLVRLLLLLLSTFASMCLHLERWRQKKNKTKMLHVMYNKNVTYINIHREMSDCTSLWENRTHHVISPSHSNTCTCTRYMHMHLQRKYTHPLFSVFTHEVNWSKQACLLYWLWLQQQQCVCWDVDVWSVYNHRV